MTPAPRFFGKYRGRVIDNLDPLVLGRILASVPSVTGSVTNWASPCTPHPGKNVASAVVPPNGAHVWVEFEAGDLALPIWSGCFWAPGEPPLLAPPQPRTSTEP